MDYKPDEQGQCKYGLRISRSVGYVGGAPPRLKASLAENWCIRFLSSFNKRISSSSWVISFIKRNDYCLLTSFLARVKVIRKG
jgi:hypothetical protein